MIRDNGKYIDDESSIIYVLDNCSSEVLKYLDSERIFEVGIGDDVCSCNECECGCKKDEKPATASTASKSTYRVNGEEVDKDTYESALADIEDRYMDNIRDMLLNYCEFMDEMNEWRKLFRW